MEITLLQIGAPKSGNYWLYNIIQQIYRLNNIQYRSFISQQPVYKEAKEWDLSNSQQAGIDMMDIERGKCFYRISSVLRHPVPDLNGYLEKTNHVWTHSEVGENIEGVLQRFDRQVYIYRDPRDMAVSAARYAFTPYMKKHYPPHEENPEEWLEKNLRKTIHDWIWHVTDYLLLKERFDIHFVAYENLLDDFSLTVRQLSQYIGISLRSGNIRKIEEEVSFNNMKKKDPGHVKKGKRFQWTEILKPQQQEMAWEMAGELMKLLGYPREPETNELPVNANLLSREDILRTREILLRNA